MLLQSTRPEALRNGGSVMSFGWCLKLAGVVVVGGFLATADALPQQPTIAKAGLAKSIQSSGEANPAPQLGPLERVSLPNSNRLTPLDRAYLDAFSILREDNTCSAFYGGPPVTLVLNQLKQQLKSTNFDGAIAVRMSGKHAKWISFTYHLTYRLFDKAELNREGPFYRDKTFTSIGGFLPNTREARVTILLHELGHLIQRRDNQWLLPNDGASEYLSQENTARVISVCGKQIRSLSRISFAQELQAVRPTLPGPATEANLLDP
jgi:hypothetical protein